MYFMKIMSLRQPTLQRINLSKHRSFVFRIFIFGFELKVSGLSVIVHCSTTSHKFVIITNEKFGCLHHYDSTAMLFSTLQIETNRPTCKPLTKTSCNRDRTKLMMAHVVAVLFTHADSSRVSIAIIRICDSVILCVCYFVCLSVR